MSIGALARIGPDMTGDQRVALRLDVHEASSGQILQIAGSLL
jgi:hypothetical protein